MKTILAPFRCAIALLAFPLLGCGADKKEDAKPYPLQTCVVTDEKLGADPDMKPYSFVEAGQSVTLCCKSCLKTFKKDTAKYMTKIAEAQKPSK